MRSKTSVQLRLIPNAPRRRCTRPQPAPCNRLQMHILLGDDAVCRGRTQIRLCAHEHTVLRRTCTHCGLRHNLPVKYTIVCTFAHLYYSTGYSSRGQPCHSRNPAAKSTARSLRVSSPRIRSPMWYAAVRDGKREQRSQGR